MVLEKTLQSPLDCKEIKSIYSKGNQPFRVDSMEGLMLKLKLVLWQPDARADSLEKTPMLENTEGKRRRDVGSRAYDG